MRVNLKITEKKKIIPLKTRRSAKKGIKTNESKFENYRKKENNSFKDIRSTKNYLLEDTTFAL